MTSRKHQWRTEGWRGLGDIAQTARVVGFACASEAVADRLDRRLGWLGQLTRNVDRRGSVVEDLVFRDVRRELGRFEAFQRTGHGLADVLSWPGLPWTRLTLAEGMTLAEWDELRGSDPRRLAALRRDLRLCELLVGPSSTSLTVADRLAGGVRLEPSPTVEIPIV
ncbi:hypothetical protein [Frondihabitans cladoniiphilus]|uniref:Uncharacterized protein n=1 Tax=Frondihabitans cladoniiphilus TaxID=715785 RepID=A0ABP8VGK6_9MICO